MTEKPTPYPSADAKARAAKRSGTALMANLRFRVSPNQVDPSSMRTARR